MDCVSKSITVKSELLSGLIAYAKALWVVGTLPSYIVSSPSDKPVR